jgi:chemotaxis protein MotB
MADENNEAQENAETQEQPNGAEVSDVTEVKEGQEAQEEVEAAAAPEEDETEECPVCKKGAPLWMATFADMATLLMAFFVLILSFSEMKTLKYTQIAGSMKSAFGVQKIVKVPDPPKGTSIISLEFSPTVAETAILQQVKQQTTDTTQKDLDLKTEKKKKDYDVNVEQQKVAEALAEEIANGEVEVTIQDNQVVVELKGPGSVGEAEKDQEQGFVPEATVELYAKIAAAQQISEAPIKIQDAQSQQQQKDQALNEQQQQQAKEAVAELRVLLSEAVAQGLAEVEQEGTKIIVRLTEKGAFPGGGAQLNPNALPMIRALSETINNNKGQVIVTGHTDNRQVPAGSEFPSNWDLSAVRAAAVADSLSSLMNIPKQRLSVEGMADTKPLNENRSAADRARNRRVEIVLDIAGVEE